VLQAEIPAEALLSVGLPNSDSLDLFRVRDSTLAALSVTRLGC